MQVDASERLRELVVQIESERDPVRFTVLVDELNRLLDSDTTLPAKLTSPPAETGL
jgi:hypothetical protein